MLHRSVHDVAVGGGRLRQIHIVAADITLGAVLAGDIVPAVHQTVDGDDGVRLDGSQHGTVGGCAGTDVHAFGIDTAVCSEEVVLIHIQIIGGHITGVAVVADLVPAVRGVIQNGDRHALVQHGDHGGGGRGLRPEPQGRTGGAACADGNIRCKCGDGQQHGGKDGEKQDLACFACQIRHT